MKLPHVRPHRALTAACVLALLALGLMVWSVLDPRPVPIMIAMSLGQLLGTASLGAFLVMVIWDVRRGRALIPREPPPSSSGVLPDDPA